MISHETIIVTAGKPVAELPSSSMLDVLRSIMDDLPQLSITAAVRNTVGGAIKKKIASLELLETNGAEASP